MTVKFVKSIPFNVCKSLFQLKLQDKNLLPQCQQLDAFVKRCPNGASTLVVNHGYHSLDDLRVFILDSSKSAQDYFYLAVNKFLIYSNQTTELFPVRDYDEKLILFCASVLKGSFELIEHATRSDDHGHLGNFIHPVTTMFFKRHG
jgi:hypothetical protein